jgi:hypothetical protein
MPGLSYNNNMKGWGPELCARRPDITMAMVDTFLTNMYGGARADFVYTVTRDFVRNCQTPILVLPDDVPGHPYVVAMETVHLAPNAQVSLYPWKDTPDKIPMACATSAHSCGRIGLCQERNPWQPPPSSARNFVPGFTGGAARWPSGLASGNNGNEANSQKPVDGTAALVRQDRGRSRCPTARSAAC